MGKKWWVLGAVACGTFMAALDAGIVNVGLPTLARQFSTDLSHVKWVIEIYFLMITCLLLPFGRISDMYGRGKIFGTGFVVFAIGSLVAGVAVNLGILIFGRLIQATGAAMLMSNGPAIITAAFPVRERGTSLGVLAMAVSAGLISGPGIGGLLIGLLGWRMIFLINIPIGILGAYLVYKNLAHEKTKRTRSRLDWKGSILQSLFILALLFASDPPFKYFNEQTSNDFVRFVLLASLVPVGYLFYRIESRHRNPVFDLSLLKNKTFWSANLSGLLHFIAYSAVFVLMPFFLETIQHLMPSQTGLLMSVVPMVIFIVAPISGRLSDTYGSVELCVIGASMTFFSLFFMSGIIGPGVTSRTTQGMIAIYLLIVGVGLGLFQSPNNNAIMSSVPRQKLGVASALLATLRNLSLVLGSAMCTGVFSWQHAATGNFEASLRVTFLIASFFAVAAALAALIKDRGPIWKTGKSNS